MCTLRRGSFAAVVTSLFITSPPYLNTDRVGKRAPEEDALAEKWLCQAVLSFDLEHLEMLTSVNADNEFMYSLPTGTYELPLRLHDPALGDTHPSIGLVQLRLASFAASPSCSWWVPGGLITLLHTDPSHATFLAFLGAVQRGNPQQVSWLSLCVADRRCVTFSPLLWCAGRSDLRRSDSD